MELINIAQKVKTASGMKGVIQHNTIHCKWMTQRRGRSLEDLAVMFNQDSEKE